VRRCWHRSARPRNTSFRRSRCTRSQSARSTAAGPHCSTASGCAGSGESATPVSISARRCTCSTASVRCRNLTRHILNEHRVGQRHYLALGVPASNAFGDLDQLVRVAGAGKRGIHDLRLAPLAVKHDPAGVVESRWHPDPAGRTEHASLAGGRTPQRGEQQRRTASRIAQQHRLFHVYPALVQHAVRDDRLWGARAASGRTRPGRHRDGTAARHLAQGLYDTVAGATGRRTPRSAVTVHTSPIARRPHRLHDDAASCPRRRHDLPGRRRGHREGLLHEDRLACGKRGQGQRPVVGMRGGKVDDIHLQVVEECPVGAECPRCLSLSGRYGVRGGERLRSPDRTRPDSCEGASPHRPAEVKPRARRPDAVTVRCRGPRR
jgi:hypothetical protein